MKDQDKLRRNETDIKKPNSKDEGRSKEAPYQEKEPSHDKERVREPLDRKTQY